MTHRTPDEVYIFISIMLISSPIPTYDHLLQSSRDDSNKWSNIGFGKIRKKSQLKLFYAPYPEPWTHVRNVNIETWYMEHLLLRERFNALSEVFNIYIFFFKSSKCRHWPKGLLQELSCFSLHRLKDVGCFRATDKV